MCSFHESFHDIGAAGGGAVTERSPRAVWRSVNSGSPVRPYSGSYQLDWSGPCASCNEARAVQWRKDLGHMEGLHMTGRHPPAVRGTTSEKSASRYLSCAPALPGAVRRQAGWCPGRHRCPQEAPGRGGWSAPSAR